MVYKNFEELNKSYNNRKRENMNLEEEMNYVADLFDTYEAIGFTKTFRSDADDYSERSGMTFTVDGRVSYANNEADLECLPMWHITLEDGTKTCAFPEEICLAEQDEKAACHNAKAMKEVTISSPVKIGSRVYVIHSDKESDFTECACPVCGGRGTVTVGRYKPVCGHCGGTGYLKPVVKHYTYTPANVTGIELIASENDRMPDVLFDNPVYVRCKAERSIPGMDTGEKYRLNHALNVPRSDVPGIRVNVVSTKDMAEYVCEILNRYQFESLMWYNEVHRTDYKWPWPVPSKIPEYHLKNKDREYAAIVKGVNNLKYRLPCAPGDTVYAMELLSHEISVNCPVCKGKKTIHINGFDTPCMYCGKSGTVKHTIVYPTPYFTSFRKLKIAYSLDEGLHAETDNNNILADFLAVLNDMPTEEHEALAAQKTQRYYFSSKRKRDFAMEIVESVEHKALLDFAESARRKIHCKKVWQTLYGTKGGQGF